MMVGLIFGTLLNLLLDRYAPSVPYTVLLALIGYCFTYSYMIEALHHGVPSSEWVGKLSTSTEMWLDMDPHLILYAWLPALLYGDAIKLNMRVFQKCWKGCLLLASCGVLLGTTLTALVAVNLLPFGFSFNEGMALGSILSATDPVAVVSILSALGASAKLNMLICGESLLNDGVAVVIL